MIAEFNALIQSIKALNDLVKAAHGLRNFNQFVTAVSEINAKLLDAQTAALTLQEKQSLLTNRVSQLEKEIMDLKNWDSEAKRYQLKEITPGFFAYVLKQEMQSSEPEHMLCANCFHDHQKSILQSDRYFKHKCNRCKSASIEI